MSLYNLSPKTPTRGTVGIMKWQTQGHRKVVSGGLGSLEKLKHSAAQCVY